MGIAFSCDQCGRPYRVADAMAGKRVKCKDCGAEVRIPSADVPPENDIYGFHDRPPVASVALSEEQDASVLPARAPGRTGTQARRSGISSQPDLEQLKPLWAGAGMVIFGYLCHEMPRFGWVLTLRGGVGLPPELQFYIAGAIVLLGALIVLGWTAWAGLLYLRDDELPGMLPGQRFGWAISVILSVVFSVIVLQRFVSGETAGGNPAPPVAPQAAANPLDNIPAPIVVTPPPPMPAPIVPTPPKERLRYTVSFARFEPVDPATSQYRVVAEYQVVTGTPGSTSFRWMLQVPGQPPRILEEATLPARGTYQTTVSLEGAGFGLVSLWLAPIGPEGEPSNAFMLTRPPSLGDAGANPADNVSPGPGFPRPMHRPPGMPRFPTPPRPPSFPQPPGFRMPNS